MFKGLKNMIFEDEGKPSQPQGKPAPSVTPASAPVGVHSPPPLSIVASTAARSAADQQFVQAITEIVDQGTPPQLMTFLQLLAGFNDPDERKRYQNAITALTITSKNAITAEHIKAAVPGRIEALKKAKGTFEVQMEQDKKESVGDKAVQIQRLDEHIARLQQELATLAQQRGELQSSIDNANQRLENAMRQFQTAFDVVQADVNGQTQKITLYLG